MRHSYDKIRNIIITIKTRLRNIEFNYLYFLYGGNKYKVKKIVPQNEKTGERTRRGLCIKKKQITCQLRQSVTRVHRYKPKDANMDILRKPSYKKRVANTPIVAETLWKRA